MVCRSKTQHETDRRLASRTSSEQIKDAASSGVASRGTAEAHINNAAHAKATTRQRCAIRFKGSHEHQSKQEDNTHFKDTHCKGPSQWNNPRKKPPG